LVPPFPEVAIKEFPMKNVQLLLKWSIPVKKINIYWGTWTTVKGPGADRQRRTIKERCPNCRTDIILRLPEGQVTGEYTFQCQECSAEVNIDISDARSRRYRMNQMDPPTPMKSKRLRRDRPSLRANLKIASALLVIVGVLGILSSFSTVLGSFTIRDIEEQTRTDLTSLSVSVIDSETGRGIPDVQIDIGSGDRNRTGRTDTAGLAVLNDIPPGDVEIVLRKEGYKTVRSDLVLKKGTPNVLDIPMVRGNETETIPVLTPQFRTKEYSTLVTDIMAIVMFLTGVLAMISAYYTFKGEFYSLALVGSFLSIFSFGFIVGSVLATAATITLILSYNQFSHTHVMRQLLERAGSEGLMERLRTRERPGRTVRP